MIRSQALHIYLTKNLHLLSLSLPLPYDFPRTSPGVTQDKSTAESGMIRWVPGVNVSSVQFGYRAWSV